MNEHDAESDEDIELQGIAMAAFHEHERTVSVAETEAALDAVRSRIEAGDVGGSSPVLFTEATRRRRSPWTQFGAAAAVIGMISLGLVAVVGGGRDGQPVAGPGDTLPPTEQVDVAATVVSTSAVPDQQTATTAPSTVQPPTSSVTTVAGRDVPPQTISVDAANPPPLLDVTAFATVPLADDPSGNGFSVGIGSDVVGVFQPDTSYVSIVQRDGGAVEQIEIDDRLGDLVIGPGNVAYGFGDVVVPEGEASGPLPIVAIALAGERRGEVLASADLSLLRWQEHPSNPLGHGRDGVIARIRQVNETLIGYVDELGNPLEWDDVDTPLLTFDREGVGGLVSVDNGTAWSLSVTPDATNGGSYVGPSAPAPTSEGRVIYTDRIGEGQDPDQVDGPNAMPVVAVLNPDGSGNWFRLPDDWNVVASDVWGTVLARTVDGTIELGLLDDALASVALPPTFEAPRDIAAGTAAAATPTGVFLADSTNTWSTRVLDDQTGGLALPIDGLVVYQASELVESYPIGEPIQVVDGGDVAEFTDGDKRVTLLDVGHIDGRSQILATSVTAMPVGPDDTDDRLLLIDALTLEATDLGELGGWEDSILEGRFVDGAIALLRVQSANFSVLIVEHDGAVRSSTDVGVDRSFSLVDFDTAIWVLEARFVGEDFDPVLIIRKVSVETGVLVSVELPLLLDGVVIPAGFCDTADFLDGRIVCDQSDGPPISIAIADGVTVAIPGLADGVVRFRASQ